MAKYLYTICNHARVIVDEEGSLPYNVKIWLESHKFFDVKDLSFCQLFISKFGYKCKLSVYYVSELLDSCGVVCFCSMAETEDKSKQLLFQIIPKRYISNLKNPKFSDDARKVIEKYESNSAL